MIKIENIEVFNFDAAMRGMRNPLESWDKGDTKNNLIGEKDLALAQKLIKAGTDHSKFMRQIGISMDITASLFLYKEIDQYKIGTTTNSTSTMHYLTKNPITKDCFSFSDEDFDLFNNNSNSTFPKYLISEAINDILVVCERLRQLYVETNDKKYWRALIEILPESWNQKRTWTANYQVLRNIYFARRNHKLYEWKDFCIMIENLPYGKELICLE